MLWTMRRCGNIAPSHRRIVHSIASSSIASPHRPSHRLIVHRIASSRVASPHRASHRAIASPHRASHRCIVHRIASSCIASPHSIAPSSIASPHYLKRQCEPSRPSYHTHMPHCPPDPTSPWMLCTDRPQCITLIDCSIKWQLQSTCNVGRPLNSQSRPRKPWLARNAACYTQI